MKSFLAGENAARIGKLPDNVFVLEVAHKLCPSHVGYKAPLDFHDRHFGVWCDIAHVGAQADLKATTKGDAMHGRNDRDRDFTPDPCCVLCAVGQAVGTGAEVLATFFGFAL